MIYHCARRTNTTLPPYPGSDGRAEWEALLLEDLVKYSVKVWHAVGQPKEVMFAIDGVVPMAKIKQQRLRRFKSVWLAQEERKEGLRDEKPSWDTTCITPGTSFLKRLTNRFQTLCNAHPGWSVSGAEDPGEGEHKIMERLRAREPGDAPIVVYGLDADLILLTLLNAKSPAFLVREQSEMGVPLLDGLGEEQFSFFSLDVLKQTLPTDIPSYVAAMSLLGNDFLPHSLTVKLRDDGHKVLLQSLKRLDAEGIPFLQTDQDTGRLLINTDAVWKIASLWAPEEDQRMLHTLKTKKQMRGRLESSLETRPLEWMVEETLTWKTGDGWQISPTWRTTYREDWLQCETSQDLSAICSEYLIGLQWVLDYYTGQTPVDPTWVYSRLLPPLWCDLQHALETTVYEVPQWSFPPPIQPSEQLAMVLPVESWYLIEDPKFRMLPQLLPQYWPTRFEFFSAGRIRLWECEARLPLLTIERIRTAVKESLEWNVSK